MGGASLLCSTRPLSFPGCATCQRSRRFDGCGASNFMLTSTQRADARPKISLHRAGLLCTPYDPEAHYSTKRSTTWTGYKVHLTESCDDEAPHLITDVQTTPAPRCDSDMTRPIEQSLETHHLLPNELLLDQGYVTADHLLSSHETYQVDLVGPIATNPSWQTRSQAGFGAADFEIHWSEQYAVCPQGCRSVQWYANKNSMTRTRFKSALPPRIALPVRCARCVPRRPPSLAPCGCAQSRCVTHRRRLEPGSRLLSSRPFMPNEQALRERYLKGYGPSGSGGAVTSGKQRRTCST